MMVINSKLTIVEKIQKSYCLDNLLENRVARETFLMWSSSWPSISVVNWGVGNFWIFGGGA